MTNPVTKLVETEADAFYASAYSSQVDAPEVTVVCSGLLNTHRFINKFLERLNEDLQVGALVEIEFEPASERRERLFGRLWPGVLRKAAFLGDFVIHQMGPKLRWTRAPYFWVTRGRYRVMTTNEVLGRMMSCGFRIRAVRAEGGTTRVSGEKTGAPRYDLNPTFGPIVTLKRVGKGGGIIKVFKLRTMSPYAEYMQKYVHEQNGLSAGGKFTQDTRITPWGKVLRRFWIDELPMIWNLIRRDLKIFGVRPLSAHYLSLYPEDVREMRKTVRPGLIPPFYADLPKTLDEIVDSERRYMVAYVRRPLRTDLSYCSRALWNIFVRGARSA